MQGCKCKPTADATGCEQCLRIGVELLPAIRRAGYLARARSAVSVRLRRSIEWGGHTHPPLHRARVQKPSIIFIASRCVRSLRLCIGFRFATCSRSHVSAAPFGFVPRLLEPPSALSLPPPAVSISLPLYWYIVANPLARAGLGPAFPSEIPCPPDGIHFTHAPASSRRMGQPRFSRLRVVCMSHFTSDFVPPCMQKSKTFWRKRPWRKCKMHLAHPPARAETSAVEELITADSPKFRCKSKTMSVCGDDSIDERGTMPKAR